MIKKVYKKYLILLLLITIIVLFFIWQNNDIVISKYIYETNIISSNSILNGYKIAQVSDLHNKEFGKDSRRLLNILRKEKPDMIAITGDIIDSNHTDLQVALEFIKAAMEIAPTYYATGNHEYWVDANIREELLQGIVSSSASILDNKVIELKQENNESFYLLGLDDNNLTDSTLENLRSNLDQDKLQILLAHEPQYLNNYSKAEVDLVLSGHAHGGQFRLPFVGGIVAPGQGFFPRYTAGTHQINNTTMIVSRGLGNSIIPVRIFNRPEIVIVKLQSK